MVEAACWIFDHILTDLWIFYDSEIKIKYLLDVLSVSDFWREINVNKDVNKEIFIKLSILNIKIIDFNSIDAFLPHFSTNLVANTKAFHLVESKISKTILFVENPNWREFFFSYFKVHPYF